MFSLIRNRKISRRPAGGQCGMSMIEMIIAMCIMSIGILAVAILQSTAARNATSGNIITLATLEASKRVEVLKNMGTAAEQDAENGSDVISGAFRIRTTVAVPVYAGGAGSRIITVRVTSQGGRGGWVSTNGVVLTSISQGNGKI